MGVAVTPPPRAHVWTEQGVTNHAQVQLRGPDTYELDIATSPEDESIELAIPSRAGTDAGGEECR